MCRWNNRRVRPRSEVLRWSLSNCHNMMPAFELRVTVESSILASSRIAIGRPSRVLLDMTDIPRVGTGEWPFVIPASAKLLLCHFDPARECEAPAESLRSIERGEPSADQGADSQPILKGSPKTLRMRKPGGNSAWRRFWGLV